MQPEQITLQYLPPQFWSHEDYVRRERHGVRPVAFKVNDEPGYCTLDQLAKLTNTNSGNAIEYGAGDDTTL